jgi:hypothetical protein
LRGLADEAPIDYVSPEGDESIDGKYSENYAQLDGDGDSGNGTSTRSEESSISPVGAGDENVAEDTGSFDATVVQESFNGAESFGRVTWGAATSFAAVVAAMLL